MGDDAPVGRHFGHEQVRRFPFVEALGARFRNTFQGRGKIALYERVAGHEGGALVRELGHGRRVGFKAAHPRGV